MNISNQKKKRAGRIVYVILAVIVAFAMIMPHMLAARSTAHAAKKSKLTVKETTLKYKHNTYYSSGKHNFKKYKVDGKVSFCTEYFVVNTKGKYSAVSGKKLNLSKDHQNTLNRIANIGYNSKRKSDAWYCTVQMMVWEKLKEWKVPGNIGGGSFSTIEKGTTIPGYKEKKATINKELKEMDKALAKTPSFDKKTVKIKKDTTQTITAKDKNKVLSLGYKVTSKPDGVTAKISGNNLIITLSKNAEPGRIEVKYKSKDALGGNSYFYSSASQNQASLGEITIANLATINFTYTPEEPKTGEVSIKKVIDRTDDANFSLLGENPDITKIKFAIYADEDVKVNGKVVYSKDSMVQEKNCAEDGTVTFTKIYPGTYHIKETETLPGLLLDDTTYPVKATKTKRGDVEISVSTLISETNTVTSETNKESIEALNFIKIAEGDELTKSTAIEKANAKAYSISSSSEDDKGEAGETGDSGETANEDSTDDDADDQTDADTSDDNNASDAGKKKEIDVKADLSKVDTSSAGVYDVTFSTENGTQIAAKVYVTEEGADTTEYDDTIYNKPTETYLTKTDIGGDDEVPGAKMKLTDSDGNIIHEWESTDEAYVIEGLEVGKEYNLIETDAPDGYVKRTEAVTFTVDETGEVQNDVIMKDKTVPFFKVDEDGKIISGAKFKVTDEEGNTIEEFTGDFQDVGKTVDEGKGYLISGLEIGKTYTISEVESPAEYQKSEDVTFTVEDDDEDQVITMTDAKCNIHTTATVNGKHVAEIAKKTKLIDVITYENLNAGQEYEYVARLMNDKGNQVKINGKGVTKKGTFIPKTSNGKVQVDFGTFDSTSLAGTSTVVYEKVYTNGKLAAKHEDKNDKGQTIHFKEGRGNLTTEYTPNEGGGESGGGDSFVKTGDAFLYMILIAVLIASGVTAYVFYRRKRSE